MLVSRYESHSPYIPELLPGNFQRMEIHRWFIINHKWMKNEVNTVFIQE